MKGGIAVVTSGFPRRSETFVLNELLALEEAGLLAGVFATKTGDGTAQPGVELLLPGVRVLPAGSPTKQAHAVARALSGRRVAGVHGYFAHAPAEVAALAATRIGVRYSFGVHARDARKAGQRSLTARVRAAASVIACNADAAAEIRRVGGRPDVLPHGVDLQRFQPPPRRAHGPMRLLAVGRLVPKKGFDVLLEAARELSFPFHLRIVGEGPERTLLETAIAAARLTGLVELCGPKTHAELPGEYAAADVVVAPSVEDRSGDRDGLPNVVLESMAAGRPVVATDVGAIASAVADGVTGLLVPPGDAVALAAALERLAGHPGLRERLGSIGRRRAEREFALERCTARLREHLEAVHG